MVTNEAWAWGEQLHPGIVLGARIAGVAIQLRWAGRPSPSQTLNRRGSAVTASEAARVAARTAGPAGASEELDPDIARLDAAVRARGLDRALADAGEPNPVDGAFLAAWLQAAGGDARQAEFLLNEHLKWRRAVATAEGGRVTADQVPQQLAAEKTFLTAAGPRGQPLLVVLGKRHFGGNLPQFTRLLAFAIDGAVRSAHHDANSGRRIYAAVDLRGIRMGNLDVPTMRELFEVIGRHYPGNLERFWFLDAPFIFNGLWRVIKPIVPAVVRPRVGFVKRAKDGSCQELLDALGREALPAHLGGDAELVPVQDAVEALEGAPRAVIGLGQGTSSLPAQSAPPRRRRPAALLLPGGAAARDGEAPRPHMPLHLSRVEVAMVFLALWLMYLVVCSSREPRLQQFLGNTAESKYYAAMSVLTAQVYQQAQGLMLGLPRPPG
eukprot:jgi/Tetstr1/439279/TSEL_027721.t1